MCKFDEPAPLSLAVLSHPLSPLPSPHLLEKGRAYKHACQRRVYVRENRKKAERKKLREKKIADYARTLMRPYFREFSGRIVDA